jgi:hypothetical protein
LAGDRMGGRSAELLFAKARAQALAPTLGSVERWRDRRHTEDEGQGSPHVGKRTRGTAAIGSILMAGSLILGLTGCGGSDSGSVKVGLITKTDSNPYFVKLRVAAQSQADKDGAKLISLGGAFDGDDEGQVAAIENLVGQGVKGSGARLRRIGRGIDG